MRDIAIAYGALSDRTGSSSSFQWLDHALPPPSDGTVIVRAGTPLGGGASPVWGCTLIVVACPRGVYTGRIWERPTMGETGESPHTWESDVEAFLGLNDAITGPLDARRNSTLASLSQPGGPFDPDGFGGWMFASIITPRNDEFAPDLPLYQNTAAKLRIAIAEALHQPVSNIDQWLYPKQLVSNVQADPAAGLLSFQYAPNHMTDPSIPSLQGGDLEKGTDGTRVLRIWFDQVVLFEVSWCKPLQDELVVTTATSGMSTTTTTTTTTAVATADIAAPTSIQARDVPLPAAVTTWVGHPILDAACPLMLVGRNPEAYPVPMIVPYATTTVITVVPSRTATATATATATLSVLCRPETCGNFCRVGGLDGGGGAGRTSNSPDHIAARGHGNPKGAQVLLQPQLTSPRDSDDTDWWLKMTDIVGAYGADYGGERLYGSSRAAFVPLDTTDQYGIVTSPDVGLGGGVVPVWGCAAITVATNWGVYTAHIWESDYSTGPGTPLWTLGVTSFFADGDVGDVEGGRFLNASPALQELADAADGPFNPDRRDWISVNLAVRQMPPRTLSLTRADLAHVPAWPAGAFGLVNTLSAVLHVNPSQVNVVTYDAGEEYGLEADDGSGDVTAGWGSTRDGSQRCIDFPGICLMSFQWAPREDVDSGQDVHRLRIWFGWEVIDDKRYTTGYVIHCDPIDGLAPCRDPDGFLAEGPQGCLVDSVPAGVHLRGLGQSPGAALLVLTHGGTSPNTWIGGPDDWYAKMQRVVIENGADYGFYRAPGDAATFWPPSTPLSRSALTLLDHVERQPNLDGSSVNTWIYADAPLGGGVWPVYGCMSIIIAANQAVWTGHVWERTLAAFGDPTTNPWAEPDEWAANMIGFLRWGTVADPDFPGLENSPGLIPLVQPGGPLSPDNRQAEAVHIMVMRRSDDPADLNREWWPGATAAVVAELSNLLQMATEDIMVHYYDRTLAEQRLNAPFSATLGFTYAPATDAGGHRKLSIWWDRQNAPIDELLWTRP